MCSRVVHKKCHLSVLTDCVAKKPENLEDVSREEGGREGGREERKGREGGREHGCRQWGGGMGGLCPPPQFFNQLDNKA